MCHWWTHLPTNSGHEFWNSPHACEPILKEPTLGTTACVLETESSSGNPFTLVLSQSCVEIPIDKTVMGMILDGYNWSPAILPTFEDLITSNQLSFLAGSKLVPTKWIILHGVLMGPSRAAFHCRVYPHGWPTVRCDHARSRYCWSGRRQRWDFRHGEIQDVRN